MEADQTSRQAARVVLVTGAAKRVGAAIARRLHAGGARVAIHYRDSAPAANALAAEFNASRANSAVCVAGDLLLPETARQLVQSTVEVFGRLDALVNNASSFFPTPLDAIDATAWDVLVGSNFRAPLFLSQAAAPWLRRARGAIVNLSDIHGERPLAGYPLYSAAKGALSSLTRALAVELAPEVRVNAVAPGPVLWPEDDSFAAGDRAAIIAHTLLQRAGTAEDVAGAVEFLLSADYVTGQVLAVDGGRSAHL